MTLSQIWLLTEFYINEYRFPWGICNGCGMPTGDAYSSGPVPLWDLQVLQCWDKSLLNLSCFRTFKFQTSLDTSVLLLVSGLLNAPPPHDTQLPYDILFITMFYTCLVREVVYHRGEQHRKRKKLNPYIFFQRNALMDIKISIIDICYANTAPIPKTLMISLLHKWKIE